MTSSYEDSLKVQQELEDKPRKKIVDFCRENNITSSELYVAYQMALGIFDSENKEPQIREEVRRLAKIIDKYTQDGCPANKVVELIEERREYENMPQNFENMINNIGLTEKEIKLLIKIMNKEKEGTLSVYTKGGTHELEELSVTELSQKKDYQASDFAKDLTKLLKSAIFKAGKRGIEIGLTS